MTAKNPPCTVTDFKKTGIVAKNTQIPPSAHRQESRGARARMRRNARFALHQFKTANDRAGSQREVALFGLTSASTSSGHSVKSRFDSPVPIATDGDHLVSAQQEELGRLLRFPSP
jgi:hypothetical protein